MHSIVFTFTFTSSLTCLHTFWHAIPTSYSHRGCLILTFNTATFLFSASSKNLYTKTKSNGMAYYSDRDRCPCPGGFHSNHHHRDCGFLPSDGWVVSNFPLNLRSWLIPHYQKPFSVADRLTETLIAINERFALLIAYQGMKLLWHVEVCISQYYEYPILDKTVWRLMHNSSPTVLIHKMIC